MVAIRLFRGKYDQLIHFKRLIAGTYILSGNMSTDTKTGTNFIGVEIGRQYNYKRQTIAPNKVKYTIPGGIHYEALDHAGMVYPWSLLELFDSVYADGNFLEIGEVLKENYEFYVTLQLHVQRYFYDTNAPKFPLDILYQLSYIGNSSFRIDSFLFHPCQHGVYARLSVQSVIVNQETGKPALLPKWWREKYSTYCTNGNPLKFRHPVCPSDIKSVTFPFRVHNSHCDWNKHTHYTSYVMFCYNSYVNGVNRKEYKNITQNELTNGIKTLSLSFRQESSRGDNLCVKSWEIEEEPRCLNFEIKKGDATCCQIKAEFY